MVGFAQGIEFRVDRGDRRVVTSLQRREFSLVFLFQGFEVGLVLGFQRREVRVEARDGLFVFRFQGGEVCFQFIDGCGDCRDIFLMFGVKILDLLSVFLFQGLDFFLKRLEFFDQARDLAVDDADGGF